MIVTQKTCIVRELFVRYIQVDGVRCHYHLWRQSAFPSPSTLTLYTPSLLPLCFLSSLPPSTFPLLLCLISPSGWTGWPPQSSLHPYDQATRSLASLPTPHHQVPYQGGRGSWCVWAGLMFLLYVSVLASLGVCVVHMYMCICSLSQHCEVYSVCECVCDCMHVLSTTAVGGNVSQIPTQRTVPKVPLPRLPGEGRVGYEGRVLCVCEE